jgi:hypothetical protein
MPEFDPERYLRCLGEREVIRAEDEPRRPRSSSLRDAATALVSCDVISAARAAPLLSGYATAVDLRLRPGSHNGAPVFAVPGANPAAVEPLGPAPDSGADADVVIEELHPDNPAIAWLWQTLADFSDITGRPTGLPAALRALQAAGRVPAEHPELDALLWVRDRAVAPEERRTREADPPPAVPEQWRRFRTGRTGAFAGPNRVIDVGAATPVFGGVSVAIGALTSDRFSFSLAVETSGATLEGRGTTVLARTPLAFWVSDDRGNVYLGHLSDGATSLTGREPAHAGTVEFAALDPTASELTVIAQTAGARALIRVPL